MIPVKVRSVEIGTGKPKICVSNIGITKAEILTLTKKYINLPMDIMEWRVDWYEDVSDIEKVIETAKEIRDLLGNIPFLFTFRTSKEGGNYQLPNREYRDLNIFVAQSGYVDIVDVEIFTGDEIVVEMIDKIHAAGVKVIASNHDFDKTPAQSDIVYRLRKMQDMGADILKIAVMPQCKKDVITLLAATEEMVTNFAIQPVITMSMSATGSVSRLAGEYFGSALTFGAGEAASAPGQISADQLNKILTIIHQSL
ncbi:MAG: type I 3-dehydroquinate dehydratase [Lachnospiraceae bacterium]|nr:type I 3-dehydroquinate dehydratase [Lachnospiraceae bacterium]